VGVWKQHLAEASPVSSSVILVLTVTVYSAGGPAGTVPSAGDLFLEKKRTKKKNKKLH
jgi:hypothetical protein